VSLQEAATAADIIGKVVQAVGIGVGGWWVYRNYVRGRTHVPRLQLELDASVKQKDGRFYLLAMLAVKNPGLSNVQVTQRGSALLISRMRVFTEVQEVIDSQWDPQGSFDVLTGHSSIEPGLTITEQRIIPLPDRQSDILALRLRLVAHGRSWSTTKIVAVGTLS
jgi:hypothetical protein